MTVKTIDQIKKTGAGLSIIILPVMLWFGFVLHPNIASFERITTATGWIPEWRGNFLFHFGHLLVLFAVPLIIVAAVTFMSMMKERGAWFGFVGCVLGVFGAFILAVDKGALTLILTSFQTIPDPEFEGILPALQSLLDRAGWLWITWFYVFIPIGFLIQTVGLIKENLIPKWRGLVLIAGLILLINPDIEIISAIGATLMCIGLIPIGFQIIKS
jgi:hypothetical protein